MIDLVIEWIRRGYGIDEIFERRHQQPIRFFGRQKQRAKSIGDLDLVRFGFGLFRFELGQTNLVILPMGRRIENIRYVFVKPGCKGSADP